MASPRQTLFARLPEIYHLRDEIVDPKGQLEAFVGILDELMSGIHGNIEQLYHDFFIETCADWVVPYIGDLLGVSHLKGDPHTVRADVARTVFHRRRKGTLGAIESLAFSLTGWAAHTVELRERLLWNQHLNHQRPDIGGPPPHAAHPFGAAIRGGTVTLRDPALLSFVDGAFDPFGRTVDLKPIRVGTAGWNIPNLAIFLWRLKDYLVPVLQPGSVVHHAAAVHSVRCDVHPVADPMVLFNTFRYDEDAEPPDRSNPDEVPGPIPRARLTGDLTANPEEYVRVATYTGQPDQPGGDAVGLTIHLPDVPFAGRTWEIRGANLCAWHDGLDPDLQVDEIVIDPDYGRILFGVVDAAEAAAIENGLRVSPTFGFSGPTGAWPITRDAVPEEWSGADLVSVDFETNSNGLRDALGALDPGKKTVIEIQDSRTHKLDLDSVTGIVVDGAKRILQLGQSIWIRAADGQRPVVSLVRPLRFQADSPAVAPDTDVILEGLYVTWDRASTHFTPGSALIEQAELNSVTALGCTLDPGGTRVLGGTKPISPIRASFKLKKSDLPGGDFKEEPLVRLDRSIAGRMWIDTGYRVEWTDSIVDGHSGLPADGDFALGAATGSHTTKWGPKFTFSGVTVFGRMRVFNADGEGGVFTRRLEAHDNQSGCISLSYLSGDGDRIPPHEGCVFGPDVVCRFTSEVFGDPGYAQLSLDSDSRILEQGPSQDAMGAFGYLLNTHRWKNMEIRFREFMPVGIRPVLIPIT